MKTTVAVPVPPLNLGASFKQVREELLAEIVAVCDSGYYVLGPKVAEFEENLAAYCGTKHALGLSSGTDALLAAMMTLEIGPGDEVIVPTFTFFATAGTVARLGARPVFCDIDPDTFNIDVQQIEALITPKTKAMIPVHVYGLLADMQPIKEIADRRGIAVIEDAAQAIGAKTPEGRRAGAFGTFGCLSFYPTKNLGAIGDAGALLTDDENLFEIARKLRVHGSGHTYYHDRVGGNFRIDALQAAILTIKLKHLDTWNAQRRRVATRYTELLESASLVPEYLTPPQSEPRAPASGPSAGPGSHVYHQYVIRTARRDELAKFLKNRKIGCGVYYPLCLHQQACFQHLGHKPGDFPHAEKAAAEVLALPIYPELTELQQDTVVNAIAAFLRS